MDDRASIGSRLDPRRRDEWTGINFLLGELEELRSRGLVLDDACRTIVEEYSARRDALEQVGRYIEAIRKARDLAQTNPGDAYQWSSRARELAPDRPDGWVVGIELLRRMGRPEEADRLAEEASAKFPDFAWPEPRPTPTRWAGSRVAAYLENQATGQVRPVPDPQPSVPKVSWSSVAGEFLEEHWQKLISGLAVLLIVVSSTVGASLVLGPLLWSPAGKGVLALMFTAVCAGFGLGLVRWGAERAGRMMLGTSLAVIPINLMLLGDLKLLADPSMLETVLVALDAALLLVLARGVVGALGFPSAGTFTAFFFGLAAFNAGASRGMPFEVGLGVFLTPSVVFLGSVSWLNRRAGLKADPPRAEEAYLEFGLLAFAFLSGVIRTGGLVLQLPSPLYAIPTMLAAIAGVSTARAIAPIEKDRRLILLFQQGGLTLSALAFALALARPPGPSALFSGNTLAVAVLGLALYVSSLRATRLPAYLYCGFAALFVAYFGTYYFAADLVRSFEEAARRAMGYDRKLPLPFKALNGLAFNVGLAWLSRFFDRSWSDDRLARHCHYIGLPLSIAACALSGFEPKAAVICLGGYAMLYSAGSWLFAEPRLVYLACSALAGSAFFGASLTGEPKLEFRSMLASVLGLAFWAIRGLPALKRAGEPYRIPLIRAARVMAAFAMAASTAASLRDGTITPVATLAYLLTAILALLNGHESPRLTVYLLAIAALLGTWLGGYHLLNGGQPTTLVVYGLAVATFSAALILIGEGARHWFGRSDSTDAYLDAIGWSVPLLVLATWGLAGWVGVDSVTVARTFLVGSSSLLWLTRFRREPVLVYLGLAGLATWAACLVGLVVPGSGTGRLEGWLAVTAGGCSLAYWGVGEWARRRDAGFYEGPCFLTAGALAVGAWALAVDARWLAVDSYRVGASGMLLGTTALGLIAWSRRWPVAVATATGQAVATSYLVLFSQGPASPDSAWVLGLLAALESIACRVVGFLIRKGSGDSRSTMARPLDAWALALLIASIPTGYGSPMTLVVVALASLVMIGGFPSSGWLYGTFVALGAAAYQGWLGTLSGDGLLPSVVLAIYALLGVAFALERTGPGLLERLGLPDLGLHIPPVRSAFALGLLAPAIRVNSILNAGGGWAGTPWLPWALVPGCLLMLRFEPGRGWVHAAVALTGLGFAAILAPWVQPGSWWLSASMALAGSWRLAGWGADRLGGAVRRRLGMGDGLDSGVLVDWSHAAFGLTGVALVAVVLRATFLPFADPWGAWWDVLLALGLATCYLGLEGRRLGRDVGLIGLEALAVLAAWWLAAPGSPVLDALGVDRNTYLPMATAAAALAVVLVGSRFDRKAGLGVADPSVEGPTASLRHGLVEFTSWGGFWLGVASAYFSIGASGGVAWVTLLVTSAALGTLALGRKRLDSAILGAITWCLTWSLGLILASRWGGWAGRFDEPVIGSMGGTMALFGLWWAAGWARRTGEGKGGEPEPGQRVALAMEGVAIAATVPATASCWFVGEGMEWLGAVVLLALAVFYIMVAWRRVTEWPAYVAQGFLLACYFRARPFVGTSGSADAIILSLLAYFDLGVSELMGRLRWSQYARPTRRFAMVLPLVPILQGAWEGRADGIGLFVLLATSGFYALAAVRLHSKAPAYAATVVFNAFLWLAWYRMGWTLAESPQFYLIPVGFSTILFAEVNRRELGPSAVNGARNLGLMVIYASLAAPIWQTQSFGAWLILLVLSMAGIFAGIGLRVQSFLWLGLACFVLDLIYQLGRLGVDHALARWGVMLSLGVALILFVALNEKKRIVATMRAYYDEARSWE